MVEDFGVEAIQYNDEMIVLSTQLNDWGETSADQAIALTEFFLAHYNIDPEKVYLHGYSGGGETGSLVMAKRPELYTAFLCCATKWDGDMAALVNARTPVYLVTGESDSYYGSKPLRDAYEKLQDLYLAEGLTERKISELLTLDIKDEQYFTDRGFTDQHMGGQAFAKDESIMGWLFGAH
jgi:predicted peptidase